MYFVWNSNVTPLPNIEASTLPPYSSVRSYTGSDRIGIEEDGPTTFSEEEEESDEDWVDDDDELEFGLY
jgi:hypothetical protein